MSSRSNKTNSFFPYRRLTRKSIYFIVLALLCSLLLTQSATASTESARQFAAQVLALRFAGITGGLPAQEFLEAMPGSGLSGEVPLRFLWSPFFENSIVKLGRLASSSPVALYYNPLLEIAIMSYWYKQEDGFLISSIRALPGERLSDPDASAGLHPSWMVADSPNT